MKRVFVVFISILIIYNIKAQDITVNQVGYLVNNMKLAVVPASETGNFQLIDIANNQVRFEGVLSPEKKWIPADQSYKIADFTEFNDTGRFIIRIKNSSIQSDTFRIAHNTFSKLSIESMRFYYLSRASMPLLKQYAGEYARAEGHPDTNVIIHSSAASAKRPAGTIISTPGGWYDAGDYNKYIVNSGISTFTLFAIAEHFPEYTAKLNLNIPESINKTPDIIDEALYNLRWMLTMQDPNDGGVYHKCTNLYFEGMIKPEEAINQRYVVMKSTSAALNLAAVAAQASRILRKYETEYPGLADSCLNAAKYAYQWAQANPAVYYHEPEDVRTGRYEDNQLSDEFLWAATELSITTKDKKYISTYDLSTNTVKTPGWASANALGLISIIHSKEQILSASALKRVKADMVSYVDTLYNTYYNAAYRVPETYYVWGSNGDLANQAFLALQAFYLTNEIKYKNFAIATLDYMLGRNPTKYCYVTGFGTLSPKHVHDRKSESDGVTEPIPGMLVGGANPQNVNDCGVDAYPSTAPALCYLDALCSYSTNEIAINWNAPLAYIVCALQALQQSK